MTTVGQRLVAGLAARGVGTVFGIPGVHTVELYRGLADSGLRHVTPRHEQGAGFMADGYARASGRPGVAFVITGPGLTNTLTPMAQARADSVPLLVVSSVNRSDTLGRGLGELHELPDQHALAAGVARRAVSLRRADELEPALDAIFDGFATERPGPAHLEVPLDLLGTPAGAGATPAEPAMPPAPDATAIAEATDRLSRAAKPVILAGGGAVRAEAALRAVAEALDAPVVQTVNARGLMHRHPLTVAASPSLDAVRALIAGADAVLAVGTELGPTDYDMNATGEMPEMAGLIRLDICAEQLARRPAALPIRTEAGAGLAALAAALPRREAGDGAVRAAATREAALAGLPPAMRAQLAVLAAMRDALPGARIVGDSTQPVYAGNLAHDHGLPGGWTNAATGYGALGYAIPAAIGAALADPETPVICLAGDGGAQFTLPELMTAREAELPIRVVVWNNRGYREIADWMEAAGLPPIGCAPAPPDFADIARACEMPHGKTGPDPARIAAALANAPADRPSILEITV